MILYLLLPNLAFFLLGREFFINRPAINGDYLLLWIASCYLSRRTTVVLYSLLIDLDLILSTESIYHFSTIQTIVAARELLEFRPAVFYSAVGALVVLGIAALAATRRESAARAPLSKRGQVLVGIAALALSMASVVRSFDLFDGRLEPAFGGGAIVGSGILETGLSSFEMAAASQDRTQVAAQSEATSRVVDDLSARGRPAAPYNVLVVVVESQGLLKSRGDMRRVLAPLLDPAIHARYTVDTGGVLFFGATMFGELRTLCHIYMPHALPGDLPRLDLCLPNLLRRLGYETVSYHGYNRWLYERDLWYPALGFQRSYFAEELAPLAPPSAMCGSAFKGLCDLWIADRVERELSASRAGRKFVYWLTLNSHLPVDSELAAQSSFPCADTETLHDELGPCDLSRIHFQLYARIARMALSDRLPPTRFIIVGDHMPPFAMLSERALYDEKRVPFVDLTPRN